MPRHPWVAKADDGVRIGIQPWPPKGHPDPVGALLAAGKRVEQLGFDGFYLGDHPVFASDPWVILGGVAAVTQRVMLGSVVLCTHYRNPAYLARLAADLDNLSEGRLMLGLGIGWAEEEFRALGQPFLPVPERQDALEEALTVIEGVWGPEPFTWQGRYFGVEAMRVVPRPVQQPRPPLMIAGGGERRTLRQVAQFADACNIGIEDTVEDGRRKLDKLAAYCAELGRPAGEVLRTWFTMNLVLARDEVGLQAKLVRQYPDGPPESPLHGFFGTPSQLLDHYRSLVGIGVQYFVVQMFDCTDEETLELLASEVMPRLS
jgi:alkanesulfonate monooxygenase SsuD/methylene tetrahydromethanopterin reductase-like flavin-dependent oxidoreductase (luciferase family)